jgi:hypothetical protein
LDLNEAIRKLQDLITRIERTVECPGQTPSPSGASRSINPDLVLFLRSDLGGLSLEDDDAKEYRQCVAGIFAAVAGKSEHISRSAVESYIQESILKAIDVEKIAPERDFSKRLTSALTGLKRQLSTKPSVWEVHFPVEGVLANNLPYSFGKCEFYFGDELFVTKLLAKVDKVIVHLVQGDEAERARIDAAKVATDLVKGKYGVSVTVAAVDGEAAQLLGKKIARQTVDIVNFYAGNLGPMPRSEVLLFAEGRGPGVLYTFFFAEEPPAFQHPHQRFGPIARFSFAAPHLDETGFPRMSEILRKDRPTSFEDRLISAFQWAGKASVEPRKEEAFLLFAISLESLLMERDDRLEITDKLALRGAHLIAGDLKSRLAVYKDLKRLYKIRSEIVHSGSVDVGEDQLSQIRYYVRLALYIALCSKSFSAMTTDEELMDWFKSRLLDARQEEAPS